LEEKEHLNTMEDYKRTTHSAHLKELDELRASHAAALNRLAE